MRLDDLLSKWLKTCETVEEIKDQLVKEQLLKTLVREGKPETSDDVCRLADNYVAAHKNEEMKPEPREVKKETGGRWKLMTRAKAKQQAEQEADLQERDARSGASVTGIAEPSLVSPEWMDTFDGDLFEGGRVRVRPSRSQKRAARRRHWEPTPEEVEAEHGPLKITPHALDITAGQLRVLQEADASLDAARKLARDHPCSTGVGFFLRDGLLRRRWTAGGQHRQEPAIEQLVLPTECRKVVLKLAHDIPLSGHMGKEKTAKRILQQFYWPILYRDVATYCRSCTSCQKTSQRKPPRAPLHPLPIITEPFSRIAMDIIGLLPRSRSDVLVICDYATRYPEAEKH